MSIFAFPQMIFALVAQMYIKKCRSAIAAGFTLFSESEASDGFFVPVFITLQYLLRGPLLFKVKGHYFSAETLW